MLQSARGGIKQLRIGPGKGNFKIFILSHNWIEVKDMANNSELCGQLKQPFDTCEWVNPDKLCLLNLSEGWLRISDLAFLQENDVIKKEQLSTPIFCPHLMQQSKPAFLLRTLLQHHPWLERYDASSFEDVSIPSISVRREVSNSLMLIPDLYISMLNNAQFGVAERCCIASVLYGDSNEHLFWSLALYYLREFSRVRKGNLSKLGLLSCLFSSTKVLYLCLDEVEPEARLKQLRSDLFVPERDAQQKITSSRECLFSPDHRSDSTEENLSSGFPGSIPM